jgi:hypothetical protein
MSASSTARQSEFDFFEEPVTSEPLARQRTGTADVLQMPRFPSFNYPSSLVNAASRNTAINPADHQKLLEELTQ